MTDEQRNDLTRVAAIALLRFDNPAAPSGAARKPSKYWTQAEAVVEALEPHWNSL